MKTGLLIVVGIAITFAITFFILGPSQGHIFEYFLTDEQFSEMILGDTSHVNDFRNTGNPNECWYQDDDGNMVPCKLGSDSFDMAVTMSVVVFWPYIVLGIMITLIFIVWRKRK